MMNVCIYNVFSFPIPSQKGFGTGNGSTKIDFVMKIKTILFSLIFFSSMASFSQEFKGGFLLGPTATQVTGDKLAGYKKLGFNAGLFTEFVFDDQKSVRAEMYYIQKGSRKNPSEVDYNKYVMSLHYVEVPFLFQYRFYRSFSAQGGLSFAYLFKSLEKDQNGELNINGRMPFRDFDFSANIGLLYSITENWKVGGRMSYSFIHIREKPNFQIGLAYHDRRQYNDVAQISFYYAF